MGGRGASSGVSDKGKTYGSEYTLLHQSGNIKFVKSNSGSTKTPMETMTKGRVYVTVNEQNVIKSITYHDKHNKRFKQIDINGNAHIIDGKKALPHTHKGYFHNEKGDYNISDKEQKMIDRVKTTWYTINHK